ncbi:MAG: hypothetical protein U5K43_05275 [Halofilum sp. (in: g-proteobacteria)]|nr:hypothetical protein [Halofilum sp. (in: g-proteobacteria)]
MYSRGNGVERDLVRAYAWLTVAIYNLDPNMFRDNATEARDTVSARMSAEERARAEALLDEWAAARATEPAGPGRAAPSRRARSRLAAAGALAADAADLAAWALAGGGRGPPGRSPPGSPPDPGPAPAPCRRRLAGALRARRAAAAGAGQRGGPRRTPRAKPVPPGRPPGATRPGNCRLGWPCCWRRSRRWPRAARWARAWPTRWPGARRLHAPPPTSTAPCCRRAAPTSARARSTPAVRGGRRHPDQTCS